MVFHIRDPFNALFFYQVGYVFNQAGLVHLVRQFSYNDAELSVFLLFNFGAGAHNDPSASRSIGGTDSAAAHNNAARWKIRPLNALHQFVETRVRVVNQGTDTVDHFAHIVGRDIRRHTNSDPC